MTTVPIERVRGQSCCVGVSSLLGQSWSNTHGGEKEPLSSISNFLHSALCVFSLPASIYIASDHTVHCLPIVLELVWSLT